MKVEKRSNLTGRVRTMDLDVTEEQWRAYRDGVHVRDAFPHLSPEEHEFIISGITAEEWESYFGSSIRERSDAERKLRDALDSEDE